MIIAEMCQNHNGDFGLLSEMLYAAAESGATYAKIQTIFARNVTYRPQFEVGLIKNDIVQCIRRPYREEYERLRGLEISLDQSAKFCEICAELDLEPLTTCFTREHVPVLKEIGFETIKVASYDCASFQLLRELATTFKKLIVSTGATFDKEIDHAATILTDIEFAFLHCVTIYPTPLSEVNLGRMEHLRKYTSNVGFSDHTLVSRDGLVASKAALASGANLIERHFTVLGAEETKDGPVSVNPSQLKELVEFSNLTKDTQLNWLQENEPGWHITLGKQERFLTHEELLNRDYYRGRFGSLRSDLKGPATMIFNWEEVPLK